MARVPASDVLQALRRAVAFAHGDAANVATLTGAVTLTIASPQFQRLNPNGSNRDVTLPAPDVEDSTGHFYWFVNAGSSGNLVVKTSAASTLATLTPGQEAVVIHTATNYVLFAQLHGVASSAVPDFGTGGIKTDLVAESTALAGVTVDGLEIKDGQIKFTDAAGSPTAEGQLWYNADHLELHDGTAARSVLMSDDIGASVQAWDADLDAIRALAKADGNVIVGDGATWVAESGATARTSLGLGTGDSPTFTTVTAGLTVPDGSALALRGFGTGTGDVVEQVGRTSTEAFRLCIYDETVSPAAVETNLINLPAGSMLVSVQANVESALTGGGTTVTWSIGTAGDPDKYGSAGFSSITGAAAADSLAKNSASTWFGDGGHAMSLSSAAEQLKLTGAATGGAADGDTALTVGSVRVRVVYWQLQALDAAA